MSKKFDEFLNNASSEEKLAMNNFSDMGKEKGIESEKVNNSPSDLKSSYTPHPKDVGKQDKEGQEATVEAAGQTLNDNGVEAEQETVSKDSLSDYPPVEPQEQEPQQEQEQER